MNACLPSNDSTWRMRGQEEGRKKIKLLRHLAVTWLHNICIWCKANETPAMSPSTPQKKIWRGEGEEEEEGEVGAALR